MVLDGTEPQVSPNGESGGFLVKMVYVGHYMASITLAKLYTSDKTLARNKGSCLLSILGSKSKIC